jgi:hypothetical protein
MADDDANKSGADGAHRIRRRHRRITRFMPTSSEDLDGRATLWKGIAAVL